MKNKMAFTKGLYILQAKKVVCFSHNNERTKTNLYDSLLLAFNKNQNYYLYNTLLFLEKCSS